MFLYGCFNLKIKLIQIQMYSAVSFIHSINLSTQKLPIKWLSNDWPTHLSANRTTPAKCNLIPQPQIHKWCGLHMAREH